MPRRSKVALQPSAVVPKPSAVVWNLRDFLENSSDVVTILIQYLALACPALEFVFRGILKFQDVSMYKTRDMLKKQKVRPLFLMYKAFCWLWGWQKMSADMVHEIGNYFFLVHWPGIGMAPPEFQTRSINFFKIASTDPLFVRLFGQEFITRVINRESNVGFGRHTKTLTHSVMQSLESFWTIFERVKLTPGETVCGPVQHKKLTWAVILEWSQTIPDIMEVWAVLGYIFYACALVRNLDRAMPSRTGGSLARKYNMWGFQAWKFWSRVLALEHNLDFNLKCECGTDSAGSLFYVGFIFEIVGQNVYDAHQQSVRARLGI